MVGQTLDAQPGDLSLLPATTMTLPSTSMVRIRNRRHVPYHSTKAFCQKHIQINSALQLSALAAFLTQLLHRAIKTTKIWSSEGASQGY